MTGIRHKISHTEGFYESELLVASDRNQIQISLITAIKRRGRGTNYCLWLTVFHISINLHLLARERTKMFLAGQTILWKTELKEGEKGMY